MIAFRHFLIKFWLWVLRAISTESADPADVYFGYRLLLGREPEPAGWNNQLEFIRAIHSRRAVLDIFLNSKEFQEKNSQASFAPVQTGPFTMWLDTEDPHIAPTIMDGGTYEAHVTAALKRELKADSVFVDIGANMGWFTLTAAGIARQVIAVEPNYNNTQLIYRSLLDNGFDNVIVMPYAASDHPALLELQFIHSNGHVSAAGEIGGSTTIVEARPLDDMLQGIEKIDVIKMDIEGHEPIALRGMAATLTRLASQGRLPVMLVEFHPVAIRSHANMEPEALLDMLSEAGYRLAVIRPDGQESTPMDTAAIMAEWERLNREMKMSGNMHLDLIGRPS